MAPFLTVFEILAFEIFFSKNFFSLFLKDLDELSSNRVTTIVLFYTILFLFAFEIFFSKIFFSLFLKDLDELSSNRVTTMAPFLTVFEILAFEYFFFKKFFFAFSERSRRVEFKSCHNYGAIPYLFSYFGL